jgi:hypothetical protein
VIISKKGLSLNETIMRIFLSLYQYTNMGYIWFLEVPIYQNQGFSSEIISKIIIDYAIFKRMLKDAFESF